MEKSLPDSGNRTQYIKDGGSRDRPDGKGRFDLLPGYPLLRLARHFENGANKYSPRNWEKGLPLDNYIDSLGRHFAAMLSGDDTEDHAAAIMWNIACFMWTEQQILLGNLPTDLCRDWPHKLQLGVPEISQTNMSKIND